MPALGLLLLFSTCLLRFAKPFSPKTGYQALKQLQNHFPSSRAPSNAGAVDVRTELPCQGHPYSQEETLAKTISSSIGKEKTSKEIDCKPSLSSSNIELPPFTSALLTVSYDGTDFSGWTCSTAANDSNSTKKVIQHQGARRRRKKKYAIRDKSRSVQGDLRRALARLWGNVNETRVVVEGCSRTDKGVHALGQVCQIYCLREGYCKTHEFASMQDNITRSSLSIPGKSLPHPRSSFDFHEDFVPLRRQTMSTLAYCLNRMLPDEIRIVGAAEVPDLTTDDNSGCLPFHPTLNSKSKTYRYTVVVGRDRWLRMDPTRRHYAWHVVGGENWDAASMHQAASALKGLHDFRLLRGAPRGSSDKAKFAKHSTLCNLETIKITQHNSETDNGRWMQAQNLDQYTIEIRGDRFLYKMVRNIVGTLVAAGQGKLNISQVEGMLTGDCNLSLPVECAPAKGLVLVDIEYDCKPDWQPVSE